MLARSAFHHSMNYRSVVVLGDARPVDDPSELLLVMEAFTDRLVPGRWDEVRPPNAKELKGTRALAMDVDEASAKVRTGPPVDDDEDHALDVWAGEIPLALEAGEPLDDPQLRAGIGPSACVEDWRPSASRTRPP